MTQAIQTGPMSVNSGNAGDLISQGKTIQQIQTKYQTAVSVQVPRDYDVIYPLCEKEARLAGSLFYYRWETNNKDGSRGVIQGPSFDLAMTAVRLFGNCAVVQEPLQETRDSYIFTSSFVDHETGFTMQRSFRMAKDFIVYGKMDKARKDDIIFQIGQSKAIRNVVLNAMPASLIDRMMEEALNSSRATIEKKLREVKGDIEKLITPMVTELAKYKVDQTMIERKLDVLRDKWGVDELVILAGDLSALKHSRETAKSLFGEDEPQDSGSDGDNGSSIDGITLGDASTHQGFTKQTGKAGQEGLGF